MKITFLVGGFVNEGERRWCLAVRDGRQKEHEQIIIIDPGPEAMEWMKKRIRVALKWDTGYEGEWQMLGVPAEIRDHDPEDSGVWICLMATRMASLLGKHPNFSLQSRSMRSTVEKEVIIREGKQAIIKSIGSGKIKDPQQDPFNCLRIEKATSSQGKQAG